MANRYWVGGSQTWNSTAGTKWSTTSGGASGAAAPTSVDDVFFDANSGAAVVVIASGAVCRDFTATNFLGTFNFSTTVFEISRNCVFGSGNSIINSGGALRFISTSALTSAGLTLPGINLVAATVTFQDDVTSSGTLGLLSSTGTVTIDFNGFDGTFLTLNAQATGTKILNLESSTLTILGSINSSTVSFDAGGGTTTITSDANSLILFRGTGNVDGNHGLDIPFEISCPIAFEDRCSILLDNNGGTATTISGSLSFRTPGCRLTLVHPLVFTSEAIFVNTVTDGLWSIVTSSVPGVQVNITQTSGSREFDNLALQDINFTGGAAFTGENCIDLGNVSGIDILGNNVIEIPRGDDYFLYAETSGPTDSNPFGTSTED